MLLALLFGSLALAQSHNVLVTGYWLPTNEMLRELSPKDPSAWTGKNWRGLGYDVYAYFPENTDKDGIGEGDFRVDFAAVYNDFFRRTGELDPVAIVSFGAGSGPWEIESVFPPYFRAWFESGQIPSQLGILPAFPVPASLAENVVRRSSLPREDLRRAVEALGSEGLSPWIDETGGAGDFLCGFLGYLESWYHDTHPANQAAGFIHVNGEAGKAKRSMEASLDAVIRSLPKLSIY